ncbi:MAG TPA: putative lipid II flippase FtsW [Vicinamibacteria bacterium]|nr:putative lipid II flippase FtsW [Vicinamibacteria bacterium]
MARKLSSDLTLFTVTVALLGFGLVMVWSASSALAQERHGSAYFFLVKQAVWSVIGMAALVVGLRLDYRRLRSPAFVYTVVIAATLLLILVLFQRPVNEAHRWIRLGALSFQPAELAKLAVILFLAYHIERRAERVNDFLSSLFPALLLIGWFAFLVYIQPDLGTAATIVATAGVMLYLAGVRLRYFAALAVPGAAVLYQAIMTVAYRRDRIEVFLNPWVDARGAGYQIIQSLIAVGTGGLTGVGLMEGRQKLFYLPYPYSDFIFAVIGEELGLLGALGVVLAFVLLLWRGLRAAWNAPDAFGMFLAAGLTLAIVIQAFVNISVVLGLLPTKGIPLPFISAGGSSLVFALFGVGLVLNVSQHAD